MRFFYRAMPITADYIRKDDYITPGKKFAIEHAITSAVYHGEDYGVFFASLDDDQYRPANNPGEYIFIGEQKKAVLVGIAKYDDFSASAEFIRTRKRFANKKILFLSETLMKLGLKKEAFDILKLSDRRGAIKKLGFPGPVADILHDDFGKAAYQVALWLKEYYGGFHEQAWRSAGWVERINNLNTDFNVKDYSELVDFFKNLRNLSYQERLSAFSANELLTELDMSWLAKEDPHHFRDENIEGLIKSYQGKFKKEIRDSLSIFYMTDFIREILSGEITNLAPYKGMKLRDARERFFHSWLPQQAPVHTHPDGYAWYAFGKKNYYLGNLLNNCGSLGVMTGEKDAQLLALLDPDKNPVGVATWEPSRGAIRHFEGKSGKGLPAEFWEHAKGLREALGAEQTQAHQTPFLETFLMKSISEPEFLEEYSSPFSKIFKFSDPDGVWVGIPLYKEYRMSYSEFMSKDEDSRGQYVEAQLRKAFSDPESEEAKRYHW